MDHSNVPSRVARRRGRRRGRRGRLGRRPAADGSRTPGARFPGTFLRSLLLVQLLGGFYRIWDRWKKKKEKKEEKEILAKEYTKENTRTADGTVLLLRRLGRMERGFRRLGCRNALILQAGA